jgi:hypothetical protein
MNTTTICQDDHLRREQVRARTGWNGLDYLEVFDERTLIVYFLGKAPEPFQKQATENAEAYQRRLRGYLNIEGGRRIRNIKVTNVELKRADRQDEDDRLIVRVDPSGDFSTYTLRLNGVPDIDPRYDQLDFSFKVDCPSDLDCLPDDYCPPPTLEEPDINYLAKDYASFRQLMLDRLALIMPEWKERHVPDIGIALIEVLAYVGDYLSYYQDAVATEAYLDTARQRISVRRHARLVDYVMHEGCNARTWLCLEVEGKVTLDPKDVQFLTGLSDLSLNEAVLVSPDQLSNASAHTYEVFEPVHKTADIQLYETHNRIEFYTWGERECCLPRGTTSATLKDGPNPVLYPAPGAPTAAVQDKNQSKPPSSVPERWLHLNDGDILIFEEVLGPITGSPADADPARRHAVRLTSVRTDIDPLTDRPIIEIEWAEEDALPFSLCLSAVTDAEHGCVYNENLTVARGNVILIDHGQTVADSLGIVPIESTEVVCECEGRPSEVRYVAGSYRPVLPRVPLTFSTPARLDAPASAQLNQDPHQGYPRIWLRGGRAGDSIDPSVPPCVHSQFDKFEILSEWTARPDLLRSGPDEFHFVVETDNEGHAYLRFGDGELGRGPQAGLEFRAIYRIGNGVSGNVGAGAIRQASWCLVKPAGILGIRNPFPTYGGTEPEPLAEVKLFAPSAFRRRLQRAVTADDYASLAQSEFPSKVQRAAASLHWSGSWYEAQVALDPLGSAEADPSLLQDVEARLYPYTRIGHDLHVGSARLVPLEVKLDVCVRPEYLRGHVKAALLEVFSSRRMRDGRPGFFHPDRLTFGDSIYLSKLIAAAMDVPGVESAVVTELKRYGEQPRGEIRDGVLQLRPLEVAQLENDPSFPEHGRLELSIGGGR